GCKQSQRGTSDYGGDKVVINRSLLGGGDGRLHRCWHHVQIDDHSVAMPSCNRPGKIRNSLPEASFLGGLQFLTYTPAHFATVAGEHGIASSGPQRKLPER